MSGKWGKPPPLGTKKDWKRGKQNLLELEKTDFAQ